MSPERILAIADAAQYWLSFELKITRDFHRERYLLVRIDHVAFLRACAWLKATGQSVPSMRVARGWG